ncbi:unnamed protein product [Cladocopium goreaui]|uniref:Apple domain-containing protein n=1 Tax=Cladocopium goreaui TaxID=2562237 RepID=A0A9P1C8B8_9DINO|nr:unnamed protein product [Cladocopium goreaui]
MESSDLEQLLDAPAPSPRRSGAWLLGLGVSLAVVAVLSVKQGRLGKLGHFVGLQEVEESCFEVGMYYANPVKLDATERTVETSAELCQQRCQVMPDCSHFTFWPDGGCLLTGEVSYVKAAPFKFSSTVTGPKFCPGAVQDAKDAISAADAEKDGDVSGLQESVVNSGIQQAQSSWGAMDSAKENVANVATEVLAGVNGTSCSLYPACVDVGIKEGNCCPNDDKVSLGCCNGFPKVVEEVKIAAGSECEKFPACAKMNITGGCCPTPDGIQLGCCSEI